jgi:uncharacterized protein (DUF1778 family)
MTTLSQSTSVLSVRVNASERALLEAAAEQSRTTLSEFVRRKALESAEAEILERSVVTIPSEQWEAFEIWAARPAEVNAGLARLAATKPTWDE